MQVAIITLTIAILAFSIHFGEKYIRASRFRLPLVEGMADPTSLMFRKEILVDGHLCGEINAKNGFGAYVGFTRFVSNRDGYFVEGEKMVENDFSGTGITYFSLNIYVILENKGVDRRLWEDFSTVWDNVCADK